MPTYEYACPQCKKSYEIREGFDAPNTHTCRKCKKAEAKRVLHAPRVVFKGNGFYATDSRSTSAAHLGDEQDKNGSDGDSGKKESVKPESKSEPKSEKAKAAAPAN